jgi:hypoxanthine phosphoribosyltransferase
MPVATLVTAPLYYQEAFYHTRIIVEKSIRILSAIDFDTIVCTGVSGAVIAPILAYQLRKNLFIIRKGENTTSEDKLSAGILGESWLFVDELIESGKTYNRVKSEIRYICEQKNYSTKFVGVFLYRNLSWRDAGNSISCPGFKTPEMVDAQLNMRDI